MKRCFSFLIFLTLTLCMFGCNTDIPNKPTPPTQRPSPETTTTQEEPPPVIVSQPMISISLPIVTENNTAEDGTVLVQHKYQNIELIVPDPEIADAVIIDFLNRIDSAQESADSLFEEANEKHAADGLSAPYLSQIIFEPMRIDQGILSLQGKSVVYRGAAHPEVSIESVSYDLTTGNALTFQDILNPDTDLQQLMELIIADLDARKADLLLYEGYQETIQNGIETPANWYFSDSGLVFYYPPYEIGPYSSGVITATLEYGQLTGIINDAYFPEESYTMDGQLYANALNIDDLDNFIQITEIVCTPNHAQTVIYTNGLLEHVRIEAITATESHVVFKASTLSPGDGIVIHSSAEESFRICYKIEDRDYNVTLSFSADGVPQLNE